MEFPPVNECMLDRKTAFARNLLQVKGCISKAQEISFLRLSALQLYRPWNNNTSYNLVTIYQQAHKSL